MNRECDVCGVEYEAQRGSSRYCSTRCRMRASRTGLAGEKVEREPTPAEDLPVGVAAATEAELRAVGRLETAKGQAALLLARRLETATADTGSAVASLARQWQSALEAALAHAGQEASALSRARDELAARRAARSA